MNVQEVGNETIFLLPDNMAAFILKAFIKKPPLSPDGGGADHLPVCIFASAEETSFCNPVDVLGEEECQYNAANNEHEHDRQNAKPRHAGEL